MNRLRSLSPTDRGLSSFTLVEMLTVMAIIAILSALTLFAASSVIQKGMRSRATAEIQAISTALEGYKADNGIYPNTNVATSFGMPGTLVTNTPLSGSSPYFSASKDGSGSDYQKTSQLLYLALSGQTNFTDNPVARAYMSFKRNQVGDTTGGSYVKDPWGYSYGYSTGTGGGGATTNYPYNGNAFFDLWSTGGLLSPKATNSQAWISNWQ